MSLAPYLVSGKPFVVEKTLYKPTENEVFEVIHVPSNPLKNGSWPYRVVKRAKSDFASPEAFDKLAADHKLCFFLKSKNALVMEKSVMKPLSDSAVTILCKGNNVSQCIGFPIGFATEQQYQTVVAYFKNLLFLKPASQLQADFKEAAALTVLNPNLQAEKKEQAAKLIGPGIVSAKA